MRHPTEPAVRPPTRPQGEGLRYVPQGVSPCRACVCRNRTGYLYRAGLGFPERGAHLSEGPRTVSFTCPNTQAGSAQGRTQRGSGRPIHGISRRGPRPWRYEHELGLVAHLSGDGQRGLLLPRKPSPVTYGPPPGVFGYPPPPGVCSYRPLIRARIRQGGLREVERVPIPGTGGTCVTGNPTGNSRAPPGGSHS